MALSPYARSYEFVSFGEDAAGPETRETRRFETDSSAKAFAGRMSKRINGPVDIARGGIRPWEDRYLTTAAPSPHHTSGYRFERLT